MGKQYDTGQQRAIDAHDGHFLVLAPPGCGKTDILAERIARAREAGVQFDDMLCLTFTNRASRGMRNRIHERVGEEAGGIFVGNIHRFCSNYLFAGNHIPENTCIMDDADQADLLQSFSTDIFQYRNGRPNKNAISRIDKLAAYISQSRLGHPESVKFASDDAKEMYGNACRCGFDPSKVPPYDVTLQHVLRYMQYKRERNIIDFSDILILAYDCLLNDSGHKRYKWVQVDEVQDLNPLQLAIVDELTGDHPTAMYLGDEQQAIFSFMGAKLELLNVLKKRCAGNILTLGHNYRAPKYLLDICNEYAEAELGVDRELLPTAVRTDAPGPSDIVMTESGTTHEENERALKMVEHYLALDDEERIAILVTKNEEADQVSERLTKAGVSNFKISGTDMFKTKSYKTLSSIYGVAVNDFNFMAWGRLLHGIGAVPSLVEARGFVSKLKSLMMTPSDLFVSDGYLKRFKRCRDTGETVVVDFVLAGDKAVGEAVAQIAAFKVTNGARVAGSDFCVALEALPGRGRQEGLRAFLDYVGQSPLVCHDAGHACLTLKNNIGDELGEAVEFEVFDTMHLAKLVNPDMRTYRLDFLAAELKLAAGPLLTAPQRAEAVDALAGHCARMSATVLPQQERFRSDPKVVKVAAKMKMLAPFLDNLWNYAFAPISITGRTIADELKGTYEALVAARLVAPKEMGQKFDLFLRFVESEWVDRSKEGTLYAQICGHINDMTSTINEGDLVNSSDLMTDRVFVMTVYKGKGLEFDNVVVLGAINGNYPFFMTNIALKDPNKAKVAQALIARKEDARKFYVAISRAKKRLCVSYTKTDSHGYRTRITPFMASIAHHFCLKT